MQKSSSNALIIQRNRYIIIHVVLNKPIVAVVQHLDPANTARQIANAHTLFNLINVIILLPFSKYIVKLAERLVPVKEEEIELATANTTKYIDERMFETPSIALGNTVQEVARMGEKARKAYTYAMEGLRTRDSKAIDKAFTYETTVNTLHKSILNYLLKLSNTNINSDERIKADLLFHVVNDLERISDHAENIAEIDKLAVDGDTKFSDVAKSEIDEIAALLLKNIDSSIEYINTKNHDLYDEIEKTEEEVNMLVKQYRNEHLKETWRRCLYCRFRNIIPRLIN